MTDWYMLTVVGEDRPGIVAQVTDALDRLGCSIGESSMLRLGGNFTIMMMVSSNATADALNEILTPVCNELGLRFNCDAMNGGLHRHQPSNISVRVNGADKPGIVAKVTAALATTGFNILELDSDVAGDAQSPVYIMCIQGHSECSPEELHEALADLERQGIDVSVSSIPSLIG